MKKHPILISAIAFIMGLVIGGVVVGTFLGKSTANTMQFVMLKHRADLEKKAFQAYLNESPQVAIWALENLSGVLKEQMEVVVPDKQLIEKDLMLTNARLAILYKRQGNTIKYKHYIFKALELAKEAYPDSLKNEKEILSFVSEIDDIGRNRNKNNT